MYGEYPSDIYTSNCIIYNRLPNSESGKQNHCFVFSVDWK